MVIAKGTFEIKLAQMPLHYEVEDTKLERMSIYKEFHGDLEAISEGEMLSAFGRVNGSAGYVAIEQVKGTLHGKRGSFVLQHNGIMNRGEQQLHISVVPDSGTGELVGITGKMQIIIVEGKHSYDFEYSLP
jgi:hypothetical protein